MKLINRLRKWFQEYTCDHHFVIEQTYNQEPFLLITKTKCEHCATKNIPPYIQERMQHISEIAMEKHYKSLLTEKKHK